MDDQVCLIGNVNCALRRAGSRKKVLKDVRRALKDGMPGGGYVFAQAIA
jgi:uroporphyrinogen decarboxylase